MKDEARRKTLVDFAQGVADLAAISTPSGFRVVVVVTDASGDWVGVGSNTTNDDVEKILKSALDGEDRQDHG